MNSLNRESAPWAYRTSYVGKTDSRVATLLLCVAVAILFGALGSSFIGFVLP